MRAQLANTNSSSITVKESFSALSTTQVLLSKLGFKDQQAAIQNENQIQLEAEQELRSTIKEYEAKPELKQRTRLLKILDSEIKRVTEEHKQTLANQKKFEYQAQESEQTYIASNYLSQFSHWMVNNVKYFFGSDNSSQAKRYLAIAKEKELMLEALQDYQEEIKQTQISASTGSISSNRNLLSLPTTDAIEVAYNATHEISRPRLALHPSGNFAVVWRDERPDGKYDINIRCFAPPYFPLSNSIRVNTLLSNNNNFYNFPAINVQSTGDYVVAYSGSSDLYARRFNTTCFPLGSEFKVSTYLGNNKYYPDIGVQPNDYTIFTWTSDLDQDGSGTGVYLRIFDNSVSPLTPEIHVNEYTTNDQSNSAIGVQSTGNFFVAWYSSMQIASGDDIYIRRFQYDGVVLASEQLITDRNSIKHRYPVFCVFPNDHFLLAWRMGNSGGWDQIYAQHFNDVGSDLGRPRFQLNNNNAGTTYYPPSLATYPTGGFIAGWGGTDFASNYGQWIVRYTNTTNGYVRQGNINRISPHVVNFQFWDPDLAVLPNGDWMAVWDEGGSGNPPCGVYAKFFRPLKMTYNNFTIIQGQTIPINNYSLSATPGVRTLSFWYDISNLNNGRFALKTNLGGTITDFTQDQINNDLIRFIHNGSPNPPQFLITVTDGDETLPSFAANINFIATVNISSSTFSSTSNVIANSSTGSNSVPQTSSSAGNTVPNTVSSTADGSIDSSTTRSTSSSNRDSSSGYNSNSLSSTAREVLSSSTGPTPISGDSVSGDDVLKIGIIVGGGVVGAGLLVVGGIFACKEKTRRANIKLRTAQVERDKATRETINFELQAERNVRELKEREGEKSGVIELQPKAEESHIVSFHADNEEVLNPSQTENSDHSVSVVPGRV